MIYNVYYIDIPENASAKGSLNNAEYQL